jgi:hypothetical protein
MAHFAEIDENNTVLRVVVVGSEDILDAEGNESEALGIARCASFYKGGRWLQCSYSARIRGCYPGPGYIYDAEADVFLPPPPEPEEDPV